MDSVRVKLHVGNTSAVISRDFDSYMCEVSPEREISPPAVSRINLKFTFLLAER